MPTPIPANSGFAPELVTTAAAMTKPGKGILAGDESIGTIGKRFDKIGIENTRENRVAYRELLYTTRGMSEYISGVIMFEETLFDMATDGKTSLVDLLLKQGIIPGIKVDKGVTPLYGTNDESVTQGIDDLSQRCAKYYGGFCVLSLSWLCTLLAVQHALLPCPHQHLSPHSPPTQPRLYLLHVQQRRALALPSGAVSSRSTTRWERRQVISRSIRTRRCSPGTRPFAR